MKFFSNPLLFSFTLFQLFASNCVAFQNFESISLGRRSNQDIFPYSKALSVLQEPPQSLDEDFRPRKNLPRNSPIRVIKSRRKDDVWVSGRWDRAVEIEATLLNALDALQQTIKLNGQNGIDTVTLQYPLRFPSIRECNEALAAFGDGGDLLRALRLYFKMRKAASIAELFPSRNFNAVPTPTLVTFSTIMSRANHLGKPMVAIRLWKIMRSQKDFFSAKPLTRSTCLPLVPDVRAANILMNAYAKLGNLESAQNLMDQMLKGDGIDVPKMSPNLVTYNTLIDACHKAGDIDAALNVKGLLESAGFKGDARTYTALIATVARKAGVASGANDPTLAFSLLNEMQFSRVRPNGMTYSALIDACGRCRRSDLALKGLRLMLDQKTQEEEHFSDKNKKYTLKSEVGAWTAAINACGKAGRIDTALKLFKTMPNFGVFPNTITCGAITDCLLKNGRTADSLEVFRYMKKNRIAPSEVMYTSLMTSAVALANFENSSYGGGSSGDLASKGGKIPLDDSGATKAVEVYAELMKSLMQNPASRSFGKSSHKIGFSTGKQTEHELFRVSLVFQEMEAAGVKPDLACYNALLKSCANTGDVDRAIEVYDQICSSDQMEPNHNTWRDMIRAAGKGKRVDVAIATWKYAIEHVRENERSRLGEKTLGAFLTGIVRSASDRQLDRHTKERLYQLSVKMYQGLLSDSSFLGMDLLDKDIILADARIMVTFLQSIVSLEQYVYDPKDRAKLKQLADSIISLECFAEGLPPNLKKIRHYSIAYDRALRSVHNS